MLVLPVSEKFTWKNPPYATILLVLVNIVIFAGFQSGDNEKWEKAADYYHTSGLSGIEVPLYLTFRESEGKPLTVPKEFRKTKKDEDLYLFFEMEGDGKFQEMIRKGEALPSDSPDYGKWRELRKGFQSLKNGIFSYRYRFVPAEHRPVTFLSHMFLHGSVDHLGGNMIFLWLFGCILEIGSGRLKYLGLYLVSGFFAVTFFWLTQPSDATGLVGASGAISGLMGAYTVLFGKSRIKLFMYLGFYFNYIRFPAIALLPFWLIREVHSFFFETGTNVAYGAHIGGIVSGAALGFALLKFSDFKKHDVFTEEVADKSLPLMQEALSFIGNLEFEKGRALLERAISEDGKNFDAYRHIYNMEKQNPDSDSYHAFVKRYLGVLCSEAAPHGGAYALYTDYRKLVKPRLTPEAYLSLSLVFLKEGRVIEAEEIIGMIVRKKPGLPNVPSAVLRLSQIFGKKGMDEKALEYLDILCTRYPETPEAAMALKTLKQKVTG
jgi:membrane associated rhomboid family serine protease